MEHIGIPLDRAGEQLLPDGSFRRVGGILGNSDVLVVIEVKYNEYSI